MKNFKKNDFDLFGFGWDKSFKFPEVFSVMKILNKYKFTRLIIKIIKAIPKSINPFLKKYTTYAGTIKNKYDVLKEYKFSICYENVSGVEGYITEKIFDCFKCGVVPIYLGPDEIGDTVPKDAFIDKRNFQNEEILFNYIKYMGEKEYESYRTAGTNFIESSDSNLFKSRITAPWFVKKILEIR